MSRPAWKQNHSYYWVKTSLITLSTFQYLSLTCTSPSAQKTCIFRNHLTWELCWDHDKVISVTGGILAAASRRVLGSLQKPGRILGRRCQSLLLQLLLHLSKGLLIQGENKHWLQHSYFIILLHPLNRAVQGYKQHFADKPGLMVCQKQLFSLLKKEQPFMSLSEQCIFCYTKHTSSVSDAPQIRKIHLRYCIPLLRFSGLTTHFLPPHFSMAGNMRRAFRDTFGCSLELWGFFCFVLKHRTVWSLFVLLQHLVTWR